MATKVGSTKMADVLKYSTRIAYSAEDQGFIATVPELPGCSAFGETAEEALQEIRPAIEAWISAAESAGNPIPPPASLEDNLPSGKFLVRVAKTVHAQLTAAANHEGISLNQYVGTILSTATLGDIFQRASNQSSLTTGSQYVGAARAAQSMSEATSWTKFILAAAMPVIAGTNAAVTARTDIPGMVLYGSTLAEHFGRTRISSNG